MFKTLFVDIALKIHVSPATKEILDTFNTFNLELRGEIVIKVRKLLLIFLREE